MVTTSESAAFYHTFEWCSLWEKSYNFCHSLFFVEEKDSEYSLGLPVVKFKKKGLESFFSMPMGTYGGVLSQGSAESEIKEFLLQALDSIKSFKCLKFQIVDFNGQLSFLGRDGFKPHQTFTHIVELEKINLGKYLTRRGYRQLERSNVTARRIETAAEVQGCYGLYLKTCHRHLSAPKYSERFYQNLFWAGKDTGWLLWRIAGSKEKIIGYQINFNFKEQLHLWDAASDPENVKLRANDYLMGQSLIWCQQHRTCSYNLGGSPKGAEGLMRFKEHWGGTEKNYYIYEKIFPLGKLVDLFRGK